MADYINRDSVLNTIHRFRGYIDEDMEWRMKFAINKIPSADVVEVKHGKWISNGESDSNGNAQYECSNCHAGDEHVVNVEVPYCWKCGARMDGGT